jgi:hypothetical protein
MSDQQPHLTHAAPTPAPPPSFESYAQELLWMREDCLDNLESLEAQGDVAVLPEPTAPPLDPYAPAEVNAASRTQIHRFSTGKGELVSGPAAGDAERRFDLRAETAAWEEKLEEVDEALRQRYLAWLDAYVAFPAGGWWIVTSGADGLPERGEIALSADLIRYLERTVVATEGLASVGQLRFRLSVESMGRRLALDADGLAIDRELGALCERLGRPPADVFLAPAFAPEDESA